MLSPSAITLTATIPAPTERVFALLTDPARIPDWLPGCREIIPATPLRKGAAITARFPGRDTELVITEIVSPTSLAWTDRRRAGSRTYFLLQFAGGSTTFTMKDVWQPSGFGSWLRGKLLRRRDTKKRFDAMVQNLRKMTMV
ncbi:MAG TPA: SRPBCC family protein [Gemmatimonadales bacterium]|nr:SRPBCC family protein [Gemmatimonadales bacterium]